MRAMGLNGGAPKKSSWVNAQSGGRTTWTGPAVEVEAMAPNLLRELVEEAIRSHIDDRELPLHQSVEGNERAFLEAMPR